MKMLTVVLAVVLLLISSSALVVKGEEFEFTYRNSSPENPYEWGHLHREWEKCGHGHRQSPINLIDSRAEIQKHFIDLHRQYKASNTTLINKGYDIMLTFDGEAGGFIHDGTEFYLRQLHWHKPSEHTINNQRYEVEMHLVHTSNTSQVAVLGFLYKFGRSDPFLKKLEPYIRKISGKAGLNTTVGMINPNMVEEKCHAYYRYMGSLTTPPCTESVIWTVMKEVRTVSKCQVRMLKRATPDYDDNARPTQPVDTRHLKFYEPDICDCDD